MPAPTHSLTGAELPLPLHHPAHAPADLLMLREAFELLELLGSPGAQDG